MVDAQSFKCKVELISAVEYILISNVMFVYTLCVSVNRQIMSDLAIF